MLRASGNKIPFRTPENNTSYFRKHCSVLQKNNKITEVLNDCFCIVSCTSKRMQTLCQTLNLYNLLPHPQPHHTLTISFAHYRNVIIRIFATNDIAG